MRGMRQATKTVEAEMKELDAGVGKLWLLSPDTLTVQFYTHFRF